MPSSPPTRDRGYALEEGARNEEGAACIGAPIFSESGEVSAPSASPAPAARLGEQRRHEIAPVLVGAAERISVTLGFLFGTLNEDVVVRREGESAKNPGAGGRPGHQQIGVLSVTKAGHWTASRRARSAALTVTMIPLRIPETRTPASPWESSQTNSIVRLDPLRLIASAWRWCIWRIEGEMTPAGVAYAMAR